MTHALVEHAQRMRAELAESAPETERARRVSAMRAKELASNGFFRMLVPKSLGGGEVHPRVFVDVLEELGRGDGATAWIVMTGATTGLLSAYLPDEGARALFAKPDAVYAGVFAPIGKATVVDGGYRLTGRWPFASGVENSTLRLGGGLVFESDAGPRTLPSGEPEVRTFLFDASASRVIDTWDTSGLRGTGSHDLVVEDVFVPGEHTACVFSDKPCSGSLYSFPLFGLLSLGISAVGLGIARAALDTFQALAPTKRSGRKKLAQSELAQVGYAKAEGELRAAKALMHASIDEAWQNAEEGALSLQTRADLRLAATHAARASASAVDAVYHLAGGASIYSASPLQRHFRDIHTMTQHVMVSEPTFKPVGKVLLGQDTAPAEL